MMKGGKTNMRRGFMCQTPASTAVCMSTGDPRSVIVPRRHNSRRTMVDHSMLMNTTTKYSKLASEPRSLSSRNINRNTHVATTTATTTTLSSVLNQDRERERSQRIVSNTHIVPPPPSLTTPNIAFQVVVMRVSLHCQGCAGKVKKHLSKMEGVTSFSIDLEMKRVTVMGHVSPVGVLESISKVKKAEFWAC